MKTISTIVLAACLAATGHAEFTGPGGLYDPNTNTGTPARACGDGSGGTWAGKCPTASDPTPVGGL